MADLVAAIPEADSRRDEGVRVWGERVIGPTRSTPSTLRSHGYLVIDKPAGWTSFDVVARARRILGERRIGHAGTLDPAATGVLPLAVGVATKTLEFLNDASKTYLAEVTFGVETDSQDIDGRVTRVAGAESLTVERVEGALALFRGPIAQIPPMHAAIKVGGASSTSWRGVVKRFRARRER